MNEQNPTNVQPNAGAQEPVGGTQVQNQQQVTTFDDILKNKDYQAEFDRRVQKALETAQSKWQEQNDASKTEAEKLAKMTEEQKLKYQLKKLEDEKNQLGKKLSARDLKDEAIKIATSQDTAFDPEFLNLFDFENMTAEDLQTKTKLIKTIQDRIAERAVNEWTKEKPPYNPNPNKLDTNAEAIAQAFGNVKK